MNMHSTRVSNTEKSSDLTYWHLLEAKVTKDELELHTTLWNEFIKLNNEIKRVEHLLAIALPDHYKLTNLSLIDSLNETEAPQRIIEKIVTLIQDEQIKEIHIQDRSPVMDYLEFLKGKWEHREEVRKKLARHHINEERLEELTGILAQKNTKNDVEQTSIDIDDEQIEIDFEKEIEAIIKELKESYSDKLHCYFKAVKGVAEFLEVDGFIQTFQSFQKDAIENEEIVEYIAMHPRAWFLIVKRDYLESRSKAFNAEVKDKIPEGKVHPETRTRSLKQSAAHVASGTFHVGKKGIEIIEYLWAAINGAIFKNSVTEALGSGLVGGLGFIVGIVEGYHGIKAAYNAYQNAGTKQQKTRIFRGISVFALGGAAAGMSLALLIAALGVSISSVPLLTVLVPAVVTALYGAGLWKNSYVLHQATLEEKKAKENCKKFLEGDLAQLSELLKKLSMQEDLRIDLIEKILNPALLDAQTWRLLQAERVNLEAQILKIQRELAGLQGVHAGKIKYCEHAKQSHKEKEAKVAYASVEFGAQVLVVGGTTLAVASLFGLTTVSLGAIPLAITLVGVGIGATAKMIEKIDEKQAFQFAGGVRGFFDGLRHDTDNEPSANKELAEQLSFEMKEIEYVSYTPAMNGERVVFGSTCRVNMVLDHDENGSVTISMPDIECSEVNQEPTSLGSLSLTSSYSSDVSDEESNQLTSPRNDESYYSDEKLDGNRSGSPSM